MKTKSILNCFIALTLLGYSCKTEDQTLLTASLELPEVPYQYSANVSDNNHIPTLGRVLFYDNQLSLNNSVSCASCHKQALAFADNVAFSKGFENRITGRNSMPIQNLGPTFNGGFEGDIFVGSTPVLFWDGREQNLESMVLRPIVNHVEMGISDLDELAEKLETIPYYKQLFANAYGINDITPQKISTALSAFLKNISANNTKFDKSRFQNEPLSPIELKGNQLFMDTYDCNSCHGVQDPHGYIMNGTFANIGLDEVYTDEGLADVTGNTQDIGKFKIPSLRNVILTAPYMHDGRFETLEEVIDHYSGGIEDNANLDPKLRSNGDPIRMEIPDEDKQALIAFLATLTDTEMVTDQKFSNPFKFK